MTKGRKWKRAVLRLTKVVVKVWLQGRKITSEMLEQKLQRDSIDEDPVSHLTENYYVLFILKWLLVTF